MLYPDYFKTIPTEVFEIYKEIEEDIIKDIVRQIKKSGTITATAEWQTQSLLKQGHSYREIKKEIRKKSGIANKELTKLINQTAIKAYAEDMKKYGIGGIHLPAYKSNSAVLQIVEAAKKNGMRDLKNITNTLGVPFHGTDVSLNEFYHRSLSKAVLEVSSGAFSLDDVLKRTVKELGDRGIRCIDYASGYSTSVEAAARRSVFTTLTQLSAKISEQNLSDTGAEYVEVSAHSGARPDHQDWQGEVYHVGGDQGKYKDFASSTDYGSETGLCGYNCRHSFFPFFPGISEKAYTKEELENIDPPPVTFDGKEYTYYEATQKQRQIENSIRKSKRKLVGYDATGDKDSFTLESIKLRRKSERYDEFSKAMNLPKQSNRTATYGYNKSISGKAVQAEKKALKVNQPSQSTQSSVKGASNVAGKTAKSTNPKLDPLLKEVQDHGIRTGNERLIFSDMNGNKIATIDGNNNSVGINRQTEALLRSQPKDSVVCIHNHPKSTSFSPEDINVHTKYDAIDHLLVKGTDGTEYYLRIGTGDKLSLADLRQEFNLLKAQTRTRFQKVFNKVKDNDKVWKMQSNHIIKIMAKNHGWTYERRLP